MVLARIDALRRLADGRGTSDDLAWLASACRRYLDQAFAGLTLPVALGLDPAWWLIERRARRDAELVRYAALFLHSRSASGRATDLSEDVHRYASGLWLHDRKAGLPRGLAGSPREILHRAFLTCDGDMPRSVRQYERILSACKFDMDPPLAMSKTLAQKGPVTRVKVGKRN